VTELAKVMLYDLQVCLESRILQVRKKNNFFSRGKLNLN
jgi:hypothetical protein